MFCPICKAEYRPGFYQCSDCHVDLVDSLESVPAAPAETSPAPHVLWRGWDPRALGQYEAILKECHIPYEVLRFTGDLIGYADQRPRFDLVVSSEDRLRAEQVLTQELSGGFGLGDFVLGDVSRLDRESTEEGDSPQRFTPLEWDPQWEGVEAWAVDDAAMLDILASVLREHWIPYEAVPGAEEGGRLLVREEDVARARDLIRQVVDAVPPE